MMPLREVNDVRSRLNALFSASAVIFLQCTLGGAKMVKRMHRTFDFLKESLLH